MFKEKRKARRKVRKSDNLNHLMIDRELFEHLSNLILEVLTSSLIKKE